MEKILSVTKKLLYPPRWVWLFMTAVVSGALIMVFSKGPEDRLSYIIYVSVMYTFYMIARSIYNIKKFRKLKSPILSSGKVLNFVAAMMSVLGLQTAMIAQFSPQEDSFRKIMNAATGLAVWIAVIITAVYMLIHSRKICKSTESF